MKTALWKLKMVIIGIKIIFIDIIISILAIMLMIILLPVFFFSDEIFIKTINFSVTPGFKIKESDLKK
jgi:hypothetical protein